MTLCLERVLRAPLLVLVLCVPAFAQEVVDQQNDPASTTGFGCGPNAAIGGGTILQSFVPRQAVLVGVEIRLRARTNFPAAGTDTTIRILADDANRNEIASATASVAGPLSDGDQVLVRFDFDNVALTPGTSYLIEWVALSSDVASWIGSGNDPYPDGTAYQCFGGVWPGGATDFNFITYAAAPVEEPDAKGLLKELHEDVRGLVDGGTLSPRHGRWLGRTLLCACRAIERGKPVLALMKMKIFMLQVWILERMCILPHDIAHDLMGQAAAIMKELKKELPRTHVHSRRSFLRRR